MEKAPRPSRAKLGKPAIDWIAIETAFRSGVPARKIALDHGTKAPTIRFRAKKGGWIANATKSKRQIVSDVMAGAPMPGIAQDVARMTMSNIKDAAIEDVADMQQGLRIYRNILCAMVRSSEVLLDEGSPDPRDAKTISEATEKAITGLRTIRGLDVPLANEDEDSIDADIARFEAKLKAAVS